MVHSKVSKVALTLAFVCKAVVLFAAWRLGVDFLTALFPAYENAFKAVGFAIIALPFSLWVAKPFFEELGISSAKSARAADPDA